MMIIKVVVFSFRSGSVIRLIGGEKRGIKDTGTADYSEMIIIYVTPQNNVCT